MGWGGGGGGGLPGEHAQYLRPAGQLRPSCSSVPLSYPESAMQTRIFTVDFLPSYRVAIFKRTRPTGSHRPLCLFTSSSEEQRVRHYSGIMKDCPIAFIFCESKDQQYL